MWIERIFAGSVIALALAAGAAALLPDTSPAAPRAVLLALTAAPLPLDSDDPARDRIGALRFMGAVQLRSTSALFGGVSALRAGGAAGQGVRLLGVSDTGNWLALTTIERGGRLVGVADAVMAPVLHPDGQPAASKRDGDPATGAATIVYEQDHRLVHFAGIDAARPASLAAIPAGTEHLTQMAGWPANGGGEAMAILPGGARIVISETARRSDGSRMALLTQRGVTTEIGFKELDDFSPTDAVALDEHRILVLHRQFSTLGQGAALTLVDLAPALAGAPAAALNGQLLARWSPPLLMDNMEGLALVQGGGRLFIYLISDDNFSGLQRTLLMKFELPSAIVVDQGLAADRDPPRR
jgi:hypothetical protein